MRAVTRLSAAQKNANNQDEGPRKAGRPKQNTDTRSSSILRNSKAPPVVTPQQLKLARKHNLKSRLCGDLTAFNHHLQERVNLKHDKVCAYCGEKAYTLCKICPDQPALHFFPSRGPNAGKNCFLDYHNDLCFGLARVDFTEVYGKRKSD